MVYTLQTYYAGYWSNTYSASSLVDLIAWLNLPHNKATYGWLATRIVLK